MISATSIRAGFPSIRSVRTHGEEAHDPQLKTCSLTGCIASIALLTCLNASAGTYDVSAFGAKPGSLATAGINHAIRTCHESGGGTVIITAGRYLSGTVELLSNVTLQLEPGAVVVGSSNLGDYQPMERTMFSEGYQHYGLIHATGARNIAITGAGELNGNGTHFMHGIDRPHMGHDYDRKYTRQGAAFMPEGVPIEDGPVSYDARPGPLAIIDNCEKVKITGVTFRDAPEWTIRLGGCDDVVVSGITIRNNLLVPNSDGIHTTTSRNVRISDCDILAGDDAIIVTGFGEAPMPRAKVHADYVGNRTGYAENVIISNCVLGSRSAGIRIGYGTHAIRDVICSNIVIRDSNRGIGIFARGGSQIENVLCSDIIMETHLFSGHWWGKGEPIHISALSDDEKVAVGTIKNVRFRNIIANSEAGIVIFGDRPELIQDVELSSVQLTLHAGRQSEAYGGNIDLRPAATHARALYKRDLPALYADGVTGLTLRDFDLRWESAVPDFFTSALEVARFERLEILGFRGSSAPKRILAPIQLRDGRGVVLRDLPGERSKLVATTNVQ